MTDTKPIAGPPKELIEPFWDLGTAGISSPRQAEYLASRAAITI